MHKSHILLLALASLLSHSASAQTIYLQAKQYLDVKTGKMIQPARVLIENGNIKAINPTTVPSDAIAINKPDLTLLPGLMDAHVHITCDHDVNYELSSVQQGSGMYTLAGAKNAKAILMAGFTTVRDLDQCYPGDAFVTVDLSRASEKGWIDAPHIIAAGHGLSITGGHLDRDMLGNYAPDIMTPVNYRVGVADGVDEVTKATRYQIKYGAKVIKVAATGGVLSYEPNVGAQQYTYQELKAVVDEANRHGIPVAAHAHGTEGINDAIRAGVRSIEHGSLLNDESIRLMKAHGTFLVPTTYLAQVLDMNKISPVMRKKAEYVIPLAQKNIAKAIAAGVKIGLGTDSNVIPHGDNAKELASLVSLGMTPLGALQAATINNAELLGVAQTRGQIKPDYEADIIGVTDNPLTNIKTMEHVAFVMKSGKVYKDMHS